MSSKSGNKKSTGLTKRLFRGIAKIALRFSGDVSLDLTNDYHGHHQIHGRTPKQALANLKTALRKQKDLDTGRIHILDLTALRDGMKGKWKANSKKIHLHVTKIIARNLRQGDIYLEIDGPIFLIVFEDLNEDQADLRMVILSEEIRKRVVGVSNSGTSRGVVAKTVNLDNDDDIETIDLDKIVNRAREFGRTLIEYSADSGGEQEAQNEKLGSPNIQWRTQRRQTGKIFSGEKSDKENQAETVAFREFDFVFRPMWNIRKDAVTTFRCLPIEIDGDGHMNTVRILPEGSSEADYVNLNVQTIQRASTELSRLEAVGKKVRISVPLHYTSLASPLRIEMPLRNVIQELPDDQKSMLIPEFVGVPHDAPDIRVAEVLASVYPMLKNGVINLPLQFSDSMHLNKLRVEGISFDMGGEFLTEKSIFSLLDQFAARASSLGLSSYAHDLPTISLTSAAIGAGIDYVDGDAVISIVDSPDQIYRFSLADLYTELL